MATPHHQTFVEVQHWSANHSSDNWADPWKFQPDRFLASPEEAKEQGNKLESLQAFSVGPRNCIGRKYDPPPPRGTSALALYANNDLEVLHMPRCG